MDIRQLVQLQAKLTAEKDLSEIWTFYMDTFADHPEFLDFGDQGSSSFLEAVIPKVCYGIFGDKAKVAKMLIIHIPEYHFFHAPLQVDNRYGGLIYFENIDVGMVAVTAEFPPTDEVRFSRFSRLTDPELYSFN
jgi:hypothetical protein